MDAPTHYVVLCTTCILVSKVHANTITTTNSMLCVKVYHHYNTQSMWCVKDSMQGTYCYVEVHGITHHTCIMGCSVYMIPCKVIPSHHRTMHPQEQSSRSSLCGCMLVLWYL